ncbi:MAG: hypothetical protein LBP39_02415, partial [Rickettsiales bacterium]|nr:hypothetical protein [Rickettsiales bacterium]
RPTNPVKMMHTDDDNQNIYKNNYKYPILKTDCELYEMINLYMPIEINSTTSLLEDYQYIPRCDSSAIQMDRSLSLPLMPVKKDF